MPSVRREEYGRPHSVFALGGAGLGPRLGPQLRALSRENGVAIWRDVADRLERSRRNWSEVNLSRLERYATKGEKIVVPGVLLATGQIQVPITVAGFRASDAARRKVEAAGGKALSLLALPL